MFHNEAAERNVLGSALIDAEALSLVVMLPKEYFYSSRHKSIFEAITDLHHRGKEVSLVSVSDELSRKEILDTIGGINYLAEIADLVPSAKGVAGYIDILRSYYRKRELKKEVTGIADQIENAKDVDVLINSFLDRIQNIGVDGVGADVLSSEKIQAFRKEEMRRRLEDPRNFILTQYETINKLMPFGFVRPGLSVLAGRPKMGKTTASRNLVVGMLNLGFHVLIWTPEMNKARDIDLITSIGTGIPVPDLYNKSKLKSAELKRTIKEFDLFWRENWRLTILDSLPMTASDLMLTIVRENAKRKVDFVVVDTVNYFHEIIMETESARKSYLISQILTRFGQFAKQHDLHIQFIWHIGRGAEERKGKKRRPQKGDLSLSDSAVQIVDQILFVYRESYYDHNTADDRMEIIIEEGRGGGEAGSAFLYLDGQSSRLLEEEMEDSDDRSDVF